LITSEEIASLEEYHVLPHFKHSSCTKRETTKLRKLRKAITVVNP
jgi:hypothetical protein